MRRIFLFLLTNLAVLLVLSVAVKAFGIEPYLHASGTSPQALLVFAAFIGFGGSFVSLALSKRMAMMSVAARVISEPGTTEEFWLIETVRRHAQRAKIGMPEVAVYDSMDANAFATGMNRNSSLIAVSTGLLSNMTREEAEAVLGHEITHVSNGDMVTMALIQGVVNTFVIFLSRVIGQLVDKAIFRTEKGNGPAFFVAMIISELVLGILATLIVLWFSRRREFRADAGGAHLSGKGNMISALRRLEALHPSPLPERMAAFGISGGTGKGIARLFMTHPPIEERIAALESASLQ
jgi:heat shock protein HtpX